MFWILTACLFILASLFVLLPIYMGTRRARSINNELRKDQNIALFQERKRELETDLAVGAMEQAQFDALLLESQQNLLADASHDEPELQDGTGKPSKARWLIPVFCTLAMPVISYLLYDQWGFINDVELMDLFQRTVNNVDDVEEAQELIVSLGTVVQTDDDRPWAWYFLAENFASLGMFTEAEIGYQRSAERLDESAEKALVLGRVAMAMYINADLEFTPEILEVVEQARAINPSEITILQLLAADAQQREDYTEAIQYWRLLIQSNPNSQQAQVFRQEIATAQQLLRGEGEDVDAGPVIEVNLSLAAGIELAPELRVFVAVRNAEREGMPPLAAVSLTVGDLPTTLRLDNSSAVGPFNLSSADTVTVSALASYSGTATPSSGDYRVITDNFSHNGEHAVIHLEIAEQLP